MAIITMGQVVAQDTMHNVWTSMPDHVVPYLNEKMRTEMVDFIKMKAPGEVTNALNQTSVMDTLTTSYTQVKLSESATLQVRLLPTDTGEPIICWVKTLKGPAQESEVRFYDMQWNPMQGDFGLPRFENADSIKTAFTHRPDSMSNEDFNELMLNIDFVTLEATLSPTDNSIVYTMHIPLVNADDKDKVKAILKQTTLKWNGRLFNRG